MGVWQRPSQGLGRLLAGALAVQRVLELLLGLIRQRTLEDGAAVLRHRLHGLVRGHLLDHHEQRLGAGLDISRTWSWNCLSTAFLPILPISAPIPAPTAMPKKGTKNSMHQNMPQVAPAPTMWWLVTARILPSWFRMLAATGSAWITSSFWSRSASSIADSAVVSSGYTIAIRSAICASLLVGPAVPVGGGLQPTV